MERNRLSLGARGQFWVSSVDEVGARSRSINGWRKVVGVGGVGG